MKFLICACLFLAITGYAIDAAKVITRANNKATYEPKSDQFINAGMVFDWEQNRIYQVYTKPGLITDIALEPGEKLISMAGGDTQRWTITESHSGSGALQTKHVFIKPHQVGLSSNLVLNTNKRVYHIEIHSKKHVYQPVVSWKYPKSLLIMARSIQTPDENKRKNQTLLSGLASRQLNFNYHFVAKDRPKWMPRRVFNDGHKTYIEFPQSMQDSEAPALWGLSKSKDPEVINYRRYKNFYIIDFIVNLAELSLGDKNPVRVGIEREQV